MDRLLTRLRSALADARRVPEPEAVAPSGAALGEDLVAAFRSALEAADGQLEVVEDEPAARALLAARWPEAVMLDIDDDPTEDALRAAEVGVDRADHLIAETGTVIRSYAGRAEARITLVPPVSVFLARKDALIRDLPQALEAVAAAHREGRHYTVLVTGPSRTADIEKQLVIPAHGPRELLVVLCSA